MILAFGISEYLYKKNVPYHHDIERSYSINIDLYMIYHSSKTGVTLTASTIR